MKSLIIIALILSISCLAATAQESDRSKCPQMFGKFLKFLYDFQAHYESRDYTKTFLDLHMYYQLQMPIEKMCSPTKTFVSQLSKDHLSCQALLDNVYELTKKIKQSPLELVKEGAELMTDTTSLVTRCTPLDFAQNLGQVRRSSDKTRCLVCTMGVTIYINYVNFHKNDTTSAGGDFDYDMAKNTFCNQFPPEIYRICHQSYDILLPHIKSGALKEENADQICRSANFCTGEWTKCGLHGDLPNDVETYLNQINPSKMAYSKVADPWDVLIELFNYVKDHVFEKHLPILDFDDDGFSDFPTFRGSDWRGKDCNDHNKNIYPGRKTPEGEKGVDYNCNGVHGIDSTTKKPWKELLCDNSQPRGIVVVGDSAGAHFSIPEDYMNVTEWNGTNFKNFYHAITNEFDWPMKSASTGHTNGTWVESLYKIMVGRNRCNRNDFQNLGVNGGSSQNSDKNVRAIRRDPQHDHPIIMVYEMIGNDVCHRDMESMSTVENFRKKTLEIFNFFDSVMPAGSHMFILGVADGRILYDTLHDQLHPLNVTYPHVYTFLSCMKTTPCYGWMNTNETERNMTTQRAMELNQVYKEIIRDVKFKNFDIIYNDLPILEIIDKASRMGYAPKDIIEPTDGFHPNQLANMLLSQIIYEKIVNQKPDWLGPVNPNNQKIDILFGKPFLHDHEVEKQFYEAMEF